LSRRIVGRVRCRQQAGSVTVVDMDEAIARALRTLNAAAAAAIDAGASPAQTLIAYDSGIAEAMDRNDERAAATADFAAAAARFGQAAA